MIYTAGSHLVSLGTLSERDQQRERLARIGTHGCRCDTLRRGLTPPRRSRGSAGHSTSCPPHKERGGWPTLADRYHAFHEIRLVHQRREGPVKHPRSLTLRIGAERGKDYLLWKAATGFAGRMYSSPKPQISTTTLSTTSVVSIRISDISSQWSVCGISRFTNFGVLTFLLLFTGLFRFSRYLRRPHPRR